MLSMISCLFELVPQSSLASTNCPPLSRNSRTGSARTPANARDGPIARTMTFFGCVPVMMKPAIKTLFPVPTLTREEILPNCPGCGVAVGVGLGGADGVAVGDGATAPDVREIVAVVFAPAPALRAPP